MILLQHLQRQFPLQSFHLKCICALKRKSGSRNERYRNKTHMNVRIQFPQLFKTAFCAWNFSDIVFCQIELRMVIFFSQLNTIVSKYTCDERSCAATVLLSYMVTLLGPARITFFAIGELLKIHKTHPISIEWICKKKIAEGKILSNCKRGRRLCERRVGEKWRVIEERKSMGKK